MSYCRQCANPDLKGMHTCEKRRKRGTMEPQVQVITREARKALIQELPRAVPEFEEPTPESEKIAKKASRVLGYRGLLTFNAGGKLQAILESLEIEVIDPKAVFEYQSKFGRATYNKPVIFVEEAIQDDDEDDEEEEDDDDEEPVRSSHGRYFWNRVPIKEYHKAIPEFVVSKAIQVKEALPEVQVFVEELQYDPDPFLVVTCKNDNFIEQYYIEVWEEPQFEGRFLGQPTKQERNLSKKHKG